MRNLKLATLPSLLVMTSAALVAAEPSPLNKSVVPSGEVAVSMVVTANVDNGKRMPQIDKDDVFIKVGKERRQVTQWVPAQGERSGLELFILIDDASTTSLGVHLEDIREFIRDQPPTTAVGIGYTRNATVEIRQNFTKDHELAAKALRLPFGSAGAYGSPYLSVVDLMKRWPQGAERREVILVTDGIDRAGRGRNALFNPDVDTAADVVQRTGTIIHTIYHPGEGHWRRNFWIANSGQNGIAKLSDMTGGESFFLGRQDPVSLAQYFKDLRKIFDNQYLITFKVTPGKQAGPQRVTVTTEIAGVDLNSADAAWVPAVK
jgi:hypothetical protein